jgi:hypothetical protein
LCRGKSQGHFFPVIQSGAEAKGVGRAHGQPEAESKDLAGLSDTWEWRHTVSKCRREIPLVAYAESGKPVGLLNLVAHFITECFGNQGPSTAVRATLMEKETFRLTSARDDGFFNGVLTNQLDDHLRLGKVPG